MIQPTIPLDRKLIATFCQERGIRRLRLFGSALRGDFRAGMSDIDVLADFDPHSLRNSGWDFYLYGEQLGKLLGVRVDFCTHLRPWLQRRVDEESLVVYEAET